MRRSKSVGGAEECGAKEHTLEDIYNSIVDELTGMLHSMTVAQVIQYFEEAKEAVSRTRTTAAD